MHFNAAALSETGNECLYAQESDRLSASDALPEFVGKHGAKAAGNFQRRLFRKYAVYLAGLLSVALLVSGLIGLYFSYRDTRALVDELAREKARAAATRIEQFMRNVETQLRGVLPLGRANERADAEQRYLELLKLLRLVPAIADAAWIDSAGHERVRVSSVARDVLASNVDRSGEPAFIGAGAITAWYSPVYFRRETEPYLTTAVASRQRDAGVIIADINLKFVWDIVAAIRWGAGGHAYVVDERGRLISHPDISRVLRMSDLSVLPQVRAALLHSSMSQSQPPTVIARDDTGVLNLTAYAPIEGLNWRVLVEQPLAEAFAPLYGSAMRSLLVLLLGIALAAGASIVLARRMVAPTRILEAGARRIGKGKLDAMGFARLRDTGNARIEIDKLQALRDEVAEGADRYWVEQIDIQREAAQAWVAYAEGIKVQAIKLMRSAADREDGSEKHVAMENRLWPMRELLGDLLLELKEPRQALQEFEKSLGDSRNRLRGFYGAAKAAEMANDRRKAADFYGKLLELTKNADSPRREVQQAKAFLAAR